MTRNRLTTHIILLLLNIVLFLAPRISTKEVNLHVDYGCNITEIYEVAENDKYNIVWSGNPIRTWCKLTFHGRSLRNVLDSCTVCAEDEIYDVRDEFFTLKFYKGFDLNHSKKFGNNSAAGINYCAPESQYLDLELASSSRKSASHVKIVVSASLTSKAKRFRTGDLPDSSFTVFRVIIPLVLAVIISVLGIMVKQKRRKTAFKTQRIILPTSTQQILDPPPYAEHSSYQVVQPTTPMLGGPPPSYEEVVDASHHIIHVQTDEQNVCGSEYNDAAERAVCGSETSGREKCGMCPSEPSEVGKSSEGMSGESLREKSIVSPLESETGSATRNGLSVARNGADSEECIVRKGKINI